MKKTVTRIAVAFCVTLLSALAASPAMAYTLTITVTTDGAQSTDGGYLNIFCRASSSDPWGSCGSSVAAGTQVSIDAVANEGYWFMWFGTSPYLAGCSTMNWGWGYHANPQTHCGFTMPSSNASVNAEFQLP